MAGGRRGARAARAAARPAVPLAGAARARLGGRLRAPRSTTTSRRWSPRSKCTIAVSASARSTCRPPLFTPEKLHKAAYYFQKKGADGAGRLFVVGFERRDRRPAVLLRPGDALARGAALERGDAGRLRRDRALEGDGDEARHARAAGARHRGSRPFEHRMILNPITDDTGKVVGLAGLVIDAAHFERVVLPGIVAASLPKFFGKEAGSRAGGDGARRRGSRARARRRGPGASRGRLARLRLPVPGPRRRHPRPPLDPRRIGRAATSGSTSASRCS